MKTAPNPDARAAATKISRARSALILDNPFFAHLALRLTVRPDPRARTIATDGRELLFNAPWVNAQSHQHMVTIIAHEAMHCSLCHPLRCGGRDHQLANIAMDHAVNLILKDAKFVMPPHATMDVRFAGMSFEKIYAVLEKEQPPNGGGGKPAPGAGEPYPDYGGTGCVIEPTDAADKPLPQAEREELERDWKVATLQAAQAAKAQGMLPGGLESLIEGIRRPQIDWRAWLRDFVRAAARNDYSWKRPDELFLAAGYYLPSLYDETMGPIVMGVDTSGSVSDTELQHVCTELNACLDTARPEAVHVVYVDARVHSHETFAPDDWPVRMAAKGRGGTHLAPLWPYIDEKDIAPVCAIVTTDMKLRVSDLGDEPPYPVLFLSTGRDAPMDGPLPFGTLVRVEVEA